MRKIAGPTCHISLLPASSASLPPNSFSFPRHRRRTSRRPRPRALHLYSPPAPAPPRSTPGHLTAGPCRPRACAAPAHAPPAPPPSTATAKPHRHHSSSPPQLHASKPKPLHVAPHSAHTPHANLHCFPHHARQLLDELSKSFLCRLTLALAHQQPRSHHYSPRWAAKRGRARRSWSRSRSTSGPVQRGRPRWWPRPPRSQLRGVLIRSGSGSSPAGAEAEAE